MLNEERVLFYLCCTCVFACVCVGAKKTEKKTNSSEIDITKCKYVSRWTLEAIKFWWHFNLTFSIEYYFRILKIKTAHNFKKQLVKFWSSSCMVMYLSRCEDESIYLRQGVAAAQLYDPIEHSLMSWLIPVYSWRDLQWLHTCLSSIKPIKDPAPSSNRQNLTYFMNGKHVSATLAQSTNVTTYLLTYLTVSARYAKTETKAHRSVNTC